MLDPIPPEGVTGYLNGLSEGEGRPYSDVLWYMKRTVFVEAPWRGRGCA
jgi:hypothetical protein